MISTEAHEALTRSQIANLASGRDVQSTEVTVYDSYGEVIALAGRGSRTIEWFVD